MVSNTVHVGLEYSQQHSTHPMGDHKNLKDDISFCFRGGIKLLVFLVSDCAVCTAVTDIC